MLKAARWALCAASLFALAAAAGAREIALTIDDAPRADSAMMSGAERAQKLIAALKAADVPEVAFFAVPRELTAEGRARLMSYAQAGHLIANHSAHHPNLRNLTAEEYLADIAEADRTLRGFPNFRPWFRYPYLSEGETREKRDAVRAGLRTMGYISGYVTVDDYDWYIDRQANDAVKAGKKIDMAGLRDLYVYVLMDAVEFYDAIAVKTLGRSPKHVLLMHENDLAALFLPDLIAALRNKGWTIISPTVAFQDPIAEIEPDTLFLGQGRVAAIAHTKGMQPRELVQQTEEEDVLDRLFAERVLHEPAQ
jgi:peptidoglycan/xylan/chitin deacetylase (PgdA/CDA1 family)